MDQINRLFSYLTAMFIIWTGNYFDIVTAFCLIIFLLFILTCYVFLALGLHQLAKRQGLGKYWLAWIPICNLYILGGLSDAVGNQNSLIERKQSRRFLLPVMQLLACGSLTGIWYVLPAINSFLETVTMNLSSRQPALNMRLMQNRLWPVIGIAALLFFTLAVGIVLFVFVLRASYVIYQAYAPKSCEGMLALSVLFIPAIGPCLFAVRKSTPQSEAPVSEAAKPEPAKVKPEDEPPRDMPYYNAPRF